MTPADRKKQLIAEGRIYRAELMIAKETVRAGLQPETLARNALSRLALIALSVWRNRASVASGLNLPALLPLAISGMSALAKRKSLLKATLVAGSVAGAVAFFAKMRRAAGPPPAQDPGGEQV